MKNTAPLLGKKILYGFAGLLLVVVVASATALLLNNIIGQDGNQETNTTTHNSTNNTDQTSLTTRLATLYKNGSDAAGDVALDTPFVAESATEGYKTAKAVIKGGEPNQQLSAIFYQTPDATWHFFTATQDQDAIKCDAYNTDDLKKAFVSFTCTTPSGAVSFVELPNPTFEIVPGSMSE